MRELLNDLAFLGLFAFGAVCLVLIFGWANFSQFGVPSSAAFLGAVLGALIAIITVPFSQYVSTILRIRESEINMEMIRRKNVNDARAELLIFNHDCVTTSNILYKMDSPLSLGHYKIYLEFVRANRFHEIIKDMPFSDAKISGPLYRFYTSESDLVKLILRYEMISNFEEEPIPVANIRHVAERMKETAKLARAAINAIDDQLKVWKVVWDQDGIAVN